jgi:hypothetical protein
MLLNQRIAQILISNHLLFMSSLLLVSASIRLYIQGSCIQRNTNTAILWQICLCRVKNTILWIKIAKDVKNINQFQLFCIIKYILSFMADRHLDNIIYTCSATVINYVTSVFNFCCCAKEIRGKAILVWKRFPQFLLPCLLSRFLALLMPALTLSTQNTAYFSS